jgi:hypothetical protein
MNRMPDTRIAIPFTLAALMIMTGCDKDRANPDPATAQNESAIDAALDSANAQLAEIKKHLK